MMGIVEFKKGEMMRDPREMTDLEREEWQRQCAENARAYLFSIDQPLVYKHSDGRVIAEYKDGRTLVVL